MTEKKILDVTCGDRTIWFQKNEPHTIYCDKRREEWDGYFGKALNKNGKQKRRHLVIDPDILCDFTDLPFPNCSFSLVVFDPPHITNPATWLNQGRWEDVLETKQDQPSAAFQPGTAEMEAIEAMKRRRANA